MAVWEYYKYKLSINQDCNFFPIRYEVIGIKE